MGKKKKRGAQRESGKTSAVGNESTKLDKHRGRKRGWPRKKKA